MTRVLLVILAAVITFMILGLPFASYILWGFGFVTLVVTIIAAFVGSIFVIVFLFPDRPRHVPVDDDLTYGDVPRIPPSLNDHVWGA
jgi:hypothetical protein